MTARRRVLSASLAAALSFPFALGPALAAAAPLVPRRFADDPVLRELPSRWAERTDLFDVPGAAVAVVKDGQVFVETFGLRDAESGLPVTPETMFYIASITKTFNATALVAMDEDGLLSLEDPVKRYLPEMRLPVGHDSLENALTIRDLLCHRHGIDSGVIVALDAYTGDITDARYWHWLPRGTVAGRTDYTNVHYTIAGKLIERVAGMDWRDWLDQRVLRPAGMTRTTGYASRLYGDPDCAIPMEREGEAFVATAQRKTDRTIHAAGGLGLSAMDGARWILLQLNDGSVDGRQIVSAERIRRMRAEHATHEPDGSIRVMDGYGLGWERGRYVEAPMLAHGGGYAGTTAFVALHPDSRAGFFVLINGGGVAGAWGAAVSVDCSRALTGMEPPWEPWERFEEQVRKRRAEASAARSGASDAVPAAEAPAVTAAHLSRPIGLYTGAFHNEWLGTLLVSREGDRLRFAFGDAPAEVGPGPESDAFLLEEMFGEGSVGRFEVDGGGEVDRIRITDSGAMGEFLFRR